MIAEATDRKAPTGRRRTLLASVLCGLALATLILAAASPVDAVVDASPVKSASEIDYPPFCLVDSNGAATGFSVELMTAALAAMGREVTFRVGEWTEVRGWLESGEVQALPLMGRTPERESLYDFTFPYMTLHGAIVVRQDTTGIIDLSDLRGKSVGVMKGDNAEEFLRRENRGIDIHTTATFDEALRALSAGTYDAVVVQRLVATRLIQENGLTNLRIVDKPVEGFQQDFCFAVSKGDSDTLALLNEGLALVMANGTERRLHAKWFAALELPTNRKIVVGGDEDYPPYEYLDGNGRAAGFNVDLTRAIAQEMGMDVEIRLGPWSEIRDAFDKGDIDVLQGMFYSPERDLTYDFSQSHTVSLGVAVVREGGGEPPDTLEALKGKNIVVQRGDIMHDFALENGLGDRVTAVETPEQALRELSEGKYDCALVTRVPALYLIQTNGWTNLVAGKRAFLTLGYCYAVLDGQSALLAQFSEGLSTLEENGAYRSLFEKWMGVYEDSSPDALTILRYVAYGVGPLLILLLAALLWFRSLRRQVTVRTEELRKSQEHYKFLTENSVDTIWTMNMDLEFTFTSPASLPLLGYTEKEWIGSRLQDHCDEITFAEIGKIMAEHIARGPSESGVILEVDFKTKDGRSIPYEVHSRIVYDNGRPVGIQGVSRDISERRRAEAERARLQEQLQQSQKMEAIGQLAGGIAHDFNNILAAILGYSELLLDGDALPAAARKDLEQIRRSAERAAALTHQILAFSRRQALRPTVVSLTEVLEGMEPLLRRTLGEDISLVVSADANLGHVAADVHQFEQVILNLAVNARNAMPSGGRLTLETANVDLDEHYALTHPDVEPGQYVMLAVSDTGIGMDDTTRERIFEPFFTTRGVGEGTGLGLATVYGIVKQSNGSITVYSELGEGTVFKIYLPRVAPPPTESADPRNGSSIATGGNETILIVEDEEAVRDLVARVLSSLGYRVLGAATVAEALEVVTSTPGGFDLLLTDMVLPGDAQGKDLAARLHASRPDLPVIYMSGYTQNGIVHNGRLDEGVDFLEKPFTPGKLAAVVREVLDRPSA